MSSLTYPLLVDCALKWAKGDPEPAMAKQLQQWVEQGDEQRLRECIELPLTFGTAGIRGIVGPGPGHMNLAVIRRVTRAIVEHVAQQQLGQRPIVFGYDARLDSERFATEAVAVARAAGAPVIEFAGCVPTPLVAYASLANRAAAGVMVTASHNPPEYNGYKVYGDSAIQIVSPTDTEIAEGIQKLPPACDIPVLRQSSNPSDRLLDVDCVDAYIASVLEQRPQPATYPLRVAYTPLHGVGWSVFERLFHAAGYTDIHPVPSQVQPDGHFPTVRFPNPEESGTLDLGVQFAHSEQAHLLIANDPDADRLAIALPDAVGQWHPLSGNQLGLLLTDYLLERYASSGESPQRLVVTTLVSSPMVNAIAHVHRAHLERTLTGFKWLWTAARELTQNNAHSFGIAWEEAMGYSTHTSVRDKDGIAAGLIAADWAAQCHAAGLLPWDRLGQLYRQHGAWASCQVSVQIAGTDGALTMRNALDNMAKSPPTQIDGDSVTRFEDFRLGAERRPDWCGHAELLGVHLASAARVLARPSGTEPKLKLYIDVPAEVPARSDPFSVLAQSQRRAQQLAQRVVALLGLAR